MKILITAADVKKICDRQDKKLYVSPQTIITPAAKDTARECGVQIVFENHLQAVPAAGQPQVQVPAPAPAAINPDLIAKIVQEVIASMHIVKTEALLDKVADPSGMRLVRGESVVLDDYPTGHRQDKIKMKELFSAKESPYMSAGFMSLEDTAFTNEPKYEEIAYVLDGTVECVVNGCKYIGWSGDTFYLPANTKITLSTMGKAKLFYVTHPTKRPD